uniref:Uncharacterized protein n=1 Tax=Pipistrellus kuhlii TaxID=59472 RepID=A0A7J7XBS0_PIPKU|nr:hypothetical protein mPipKuh1_010675 [Pipistrellus kuhlii]
MSQRESQADPGGTEQRIQTELRGDMAVLSGCGWECQGPSPPSAHSVHRPARWGGGWLVVASQGADSTLTPLVCEAQRGCPAAANPTQGGQSQLVFSRSTLLTLVAMTTLGAFQNDIQVPLASSRRAGVCSREC